MTEKYKQSTPCRAEAEYAFQLNKPIIPLIMQKDYKPDGWWKYEIIQIVNLLISNFLTIYLKVRNNIGLENICSFYEIWLWGMYEKIENRIGRYTQTKSD